MLILRLDKEREFSPDECITLHIKEIKELPATQTGAAHSVVLLECSELGPPVPVEGKLAEVLEENELLKQFVKYIADMGSVGGNCTLCGGSLGHKHKPDCLHLKAVRTLALLTRC